MARNHKFYFDRDGTPKARGPAAERVFMSFLETDVQGSDRVCRVLMDDLEAVEDGTDDAREFTGNAHVATLAKDGVTISALPVRGEDEGGGAAAARPTRPRSSTFARCSRTGRRSSWTTCPRTRSTTTCPPDPPAIRHRARPDEEPSRPPVRDESGGAA